jgi:hypothetical protein
MSILLKRGTTLSQPQPGTPIDWSNPLAKGLMFAFNGSEATPRSWRNAANLGELTAVSTGLTLDIGKYGKGLKFPYGSGKRLSLPTISTPNSITYVLLLNSFLGGIRTVFSGAEGNGGLGLNSSNQVGVSYNGLLRALSAPITAGPVLVSSSAKSGDQRTYINGIFAGFDLQTGTLGQPSAIGGATGISTQGFSPALVYVFVNEFWTAEQHKALADNPWQLFKPSSLNIPIVATTSVEVYYPGSDIITTGWTATPSSPFYDKIDEEVLNTSDYITSPNMASPDPITMGWATSVPVGDWDLVINSKQNTGSGSEIRVVLLDAGNSAVGTSSWIPVNNTYTDYTVSVTTTGISTSFRIEVQ